MAKAFKELDVKVFMLANQLPLLQSGLEPASVRDAVPAYCRPDGAHYADRLFEETDLIAFSDPNDLLSYPIPDRFVRDYVDLRLCPQQVNVTINVAPVTDLIGLGEFANPLAAHVEYENDERVIDLITRGIGQPETTPVVKDAAPGWRSAKTCAERRPARADLGPERRHSDCDQTVIPAPSLWRRRAAAKLTKLRTRAGGKRASRWTRLTGIAGGSKSWSSTWSAPAATASAAW